MAQLKAWLFMVLIGLTACSQIPQAPESRVQPQAAEPVPPHPLAPLLAPPATPSAVDPGYDTVCRYIAFTACDGEDGSLFLWDERYQDVFILNGALAGLSPPEVKEVTGPASCATLELLNPRVFGNAKILFSFGSLVITYDWVTEERIIGVTDGQIPAFGGPRGVITADGHLIAYINLHGEVVLKPVDPIYATKPRVLTKIAAEANALHDDHPGQGIIYDLDISGDGRWLALNLDGLLYVYDVAHPHLFQVLPFSGEALAGEAQNVGHVAISFDGRYVAATFNRRPVTLQTLPGSTDERLLVLDRLTGLIDTIPYANLGLTLSSGPFAILDPYFSYDGRSLLFEVAVGGDFRIWRYDLYNETLRSLAILNSVLGDRGTDILLSQPALDP